MNDKPVSTIAQFCEDHDLSRTTFHYMDKAGKGPRVMRVGRRVFITREAQAEWRARMERETAENPPAKPTRTRKTATAHAEAA